MSTLLCLDTSTKACSIALVERESTIAKRDLIEDGYRHAELVHVLIDELLKEASLKVNDLSAIAVGKGPGSYTGLRIGVSTAKGLAYGSSIPIISIPSLQAMTAMALENEHIKAGILRPLLDARRMEVYSASYNPDLIEQQACEALLLEESPFEGELSKGTVYFFGDGMPKAKSELANNPNARFIENIYPCASSMRTIAWNKFDNSDFEDSAYFEPFYLKDFIAKKAKKMV